MAKTRKKEASDQRNYFAKALAEKTGSFRGPHKGAKKKTEKDIIEEILEDEDLSSMENDNGLDDTDWEEQ